MVLSQRKNEKRFAGFNLVSMWKLLIFIISVVVISLSFYYKGYEQGKEDFEKEYIPKFKEHSILIDSLSKKVERVRKRQLKLNQCN